MSGFQSTRSVTTKAGVKVLGYGQSGAGKTLAIATAPAPVILSAESGLLTLAKFDIPFIHITSLEDLTKAYNLVTGSVGKNFQTICLDSISEIAETCLAAEKRKTKDPRQAYTKSNDLIAGIIRSFRDIQGKNVYFTAKEEWNKDEQTGAMMFGPSMPGKQLTKDIPYFFDVVLRFEIITDPATGAQSHWVRTVGDMNNVAKNRGGKLDKWEQPNLSNIFNKLAA